MRFQPGKRSNSRQAFTLAEIIVVMVILAISAAVVIPYALGTDGFQVSSAARMLTADLEYARDLAITSQTPITVTFTPSGESYTLSNESGPLIHPITKTAYTVDFGLQRGFGSVDVVSADFSGNSSVTFNEIGEPDNAGKVVIQAGASLFDVEVAAATGEVTIVVVSP